MPFPVANQPVGVASDSGAPMQVPASLLDSYTDASTRDSFIRTAAIQMMCLPEYQLC